MARDNARIAVPKRIGPLYDGRASIFQSKDDPEMGGIAGTPFCRLEDGDCISKPTQFQTNHSQPNQPPAGPAPQEAVRPARGLGRSPILKKYSTSLLTPARHTRRKPHWETHFPTSHGGGTGDSILHCRSSSILARRMRSANSVSLADFAICSKASQLNPGRRTAPPSLSDFSFS